MGFRDSVKAVYAANHLGGLFAEEVTFTPELNAQSRKIWVSITPETGLEESESTTDSPDRFRVMIGRDERDTTRGGVWDLKFNATIVRSVSKDPSQVPLAFSGEIISQSDAFHLAIFVRHKRISQGRGK